MPTAPRSHRPAHWTPPAQRKQQCDRLRLTSVERGYTAAWNRFSEQVKREQPLCELCLTLGWETDTTGKGAGVTDHIIPLDGKADPLFYERSAVWRLCVQCDRWKSINFDGSYGARKIVADDRSLGGVMVRRKEIEARFRVANEAAAVLEDASRQ